MTNMNWFQRPVFFGGLVALLWVGGTHRAIANDSTRNARFWFTHGDNTNNPSCATLKAAIQQIMAANTNNVVDLGFLQLPLGYHNNDYLKDETDAWMEALGFYWKPVTVTGETGGFQNLHLPASRLCRLRKQLAVELIAALANVNLLGANPANCTNVSGTVVTTFPLDLVTQAQTAAAGEDWMAIAKMIDLLRCFNQSGSAINLPLGFQECSVSRVTTLRKNARDPSTQLSCPGPNTQCATAEMVIFPVSKNIFASPVFKTSVTLKRTQAAFGATACGIIGPYAVWKLTAPYAVAGQTFTVSTDGSNCDTILAVFSGSCTNLIPLACNDDNPLGNARFTSRQSQVSFVTDDSGLFYIVAGVKNNFAAGTVKLKISGP